MGLVWEIYLTHFIIWLITGPRHFHGTGLLHWIASALKQIFLLNIAMFFYKNEAIIRLSSHHTMQRKPEDRVLPYNGQNMIDTNKTKAFDIIASVYMFWKQFQIITINHRRHGYHISCRHIYIYNQNRTMSYLEIGFPSWTKAKDSPYRIRDCLARVSGSELEWP